MTTLLTKLVIDITALPTPEQAPLCNSGDPNIPLCIETTPTVSCGAANSGGSRPFRRLFVTIKKDVHHNPPPPRPRHRNNRLPRPRRHQLLPPPQRHDAVRRPRRLSHPQNLLPPRLQPDRHDHRLAPDHSQPPPAPSRPLYRRPPQALFARHRHGIHPNRARPPLLRPQLPRDSHGRRPGRRRVGRLSPPIFAPRPFGLRRAARPGAISFSGRRKCRLGHRTSARRLHRPPKRPAHHRLGLHRRPYLNLHPDPSRHLV